MPSHDEPPIATNGNGGGVGFSRRVIQASAFICGVVGIVLDYAFSLLGEDHLPLALYLLFFGVAWGLDKSLWFGGLLGGRGK